MSDGIFGRVFGSCLRGWWPDSNTNANKYIDFAPNRKWRYNDKNLMKELTKDQGNTWDVMDLTDDGNLDVKIASNGKLQLHDNVFVNPLNVEENNNTGNNKSQAEEISQEISENQHTKVQLFGAGKKEEVENLNTEEEKIASNDDSSSDLDAEETEAQGLGQDIVSHESGVSEITTNDKTTLEGKSSNE